ncbi:MAG TPA: dihydrofolate reductase family protein [Solirubrobacterales bacterium]|nr:dihydrofolate reductase family protein [Solirubrobacterales bacterium]
MRKLILHMGISIDGFVATADGAHDWGYAGEGEAAKRWKLDSLWNAGAHLMGRVTYTDMAEVWPGSSSDYAAPMNEIPKVVFSKTLEQASWSPARIASGELDAEIAELKAEEGDYLLAHGGAQFARALVRQGLVDEYRFVVHPAALGRGMAIFSELPARLALDLVDAQRFSTGAVGHVYVPRESEPG